MSQLGVTLAGLLASEGKSQRQLACLADVPPSAVSEVMRDRRCSPALLRALCLSVSDEPQRQLAVLRAHFADEAQRAGLTDLLLQTPETLSSLDLLPAELREDMETLIGAILDGDSNLQWLVGELAELSRQRRTGKGG